jgi:hypothetical protein
MVISSMYVFLQRSIYSRTAEVSFYVTLVEATPYKLFLRVPWVNKQLASSCIGHWTMDNGQWTLLWIGTLRVASKDHESKKTAS